MDLMTLLPQFGNFLWTICAFVIALSIIVAVHEYGHYIVGRWSGIKAEVFSIGFGPVLVSRMDKRGTRWQIAAIPLGGYVRFAGDENAASLPDAHRIEGLSPEDRRHTMLGAPLWARAATVIAGPMANFIMAAVVFTGVILYSGRASDPLTVAEITPLPFTNELAVGDVLRSIDGQPVGALAEFRGMVDSLPDQAQLPYQVERSGDLLAITGPHPLPPLAVDVAIDGAAHDAGLVAGDVILQVNGTQISTFSQLQSAVAATDGGDVTLTVWRAGETFETTLSPRRRDLPLAEGGFETRWLIGITGGYFFTPATETPGVGEALGLGVQQIWTIAATSVSGMWHMLTGAISTCNLTGPVGIAETSGAMASRGLVDFIFFIGVISVAIGFINLMPIPVLDGGHLLFYGFEAVAGRPPSDRALRILMAAGLAVVGTLMVLGLTSDLFCV